MTAINVISMVPAPMTWKFIVFKHNQHQIAAAKVIAGTLGMEFNEVHSNRYKSKDDPLRPDDKYVNMG